MKRTKELLDKLICFLNEHLGLSNGHMVDFFIKSLYDTCIPKNILDEIAIAGKHEVIKSILNCTENSLTPNLNKYITTAKGFSLYNSEICWSLLEFQKKLKELSNEDTVGLKMNVFMKSKKSHEVETMSAVAASIKTITKTSHLIDIGDGKGYLSSLLAFHHNIPVLGVDACLINTESSIKRATRLEKHWDSITKNVPNKKLNKDSLNRKQNLYKQITQYVTQETNFSELIQNVFLESNTGLGLVGLHTCGNLGPASIRIFKARENIKSICNVSCCYHLLNEKYIANTNDLNPESNEGFPMSNYLKSQQFDLRRSSRMLSAQSIDRILNQQILPNKIIFYRAIFQVILKKYCEVLPDKNVGKFRKEPLNFVEYSREALRRVGVDAEISDAELEQFYEDFVERRCELNVFHLIRSMLAPVIEALILLDRYLFLLEEGLDNVFLVQLFDPVISPRCYGLIAFKNKF